MNKRLKNIAEQLIALEKECKDTPNEAMSKMMALAKGLSPLDMLEIDNYIQSKKLLTK